MGSLPIDPELKHQVGYGSFKEIVTCLIDPEITKTHSQLDLAGFQWSNNNANPIFPYAPLCASKGLQEKVLFHVFTQVLPWLMLGALVPIEIPPRSWLLSILYYLWASGKVLHTRRLAWIFP